MGDGAPVIVPNEAAKRVNIKARLDRRRRHASGCDMVAGLPRSWGEPVNIFGGNKYMLRLGMVDPIEANLFSYEEACASSTTCRLRKAVPPSCPNSRGIVID
jgi:hypothetical protein